MVGRSQLSRPRCGGPSACVSPGRNGGGDEAAVRSPVHGPPLSPGGRLSGSLLEVSVHRWPSAWAALKFWKLPSVPCHVVPKGSLCCCFRQLYGLDRVGQAGSDDVPLC